MLRTYEPYVSSVDVDVRLWTAIQESWRERRSILVLPRAHSGYRQFHDSWWHVSVPGQNLDLRNNEASADFPAQLRNSHVNQDII
jgi:hypothetical protein